MLSTGNNFASLKKIYVEKNYNFKDEMEDKFMDHVSAVLLRFIQVYINIM